MDGKTLARIGAVVFVAVAVVATAIEMNRKPDNPDAPVSSARPFVTRDPLDEELARCSGIGEAGSRDPSCLKVWGKARRRFLGQSAPVPSPAPVAPTTLFPNVPASADPAMPAAQPEPAKPPVSSDEGAR